MSSTNTKHVDFDKPENDENRNYKYLFLGICMIILALTIFYYLLTNIISNERGTFGDMFGGLNAVFSGFAFAGVIVTILLQMKELRLTRDEVIKSTEAQNKSQIALNKQLDNMQISSKIEALNTYKNISLLKKQVDKIYIAEEIIKVTTQKYFTLDEHEDQICPLLKPQPTPKLRPQIASGYPIYCLVKNEGAGLDTIDIKLPKGLFLSDPIANDEIYNMGGFQFYGDIENDSVTIEITYKGMTVTNEWKQIILFTKESDAKYHISITVPELIVRTNYIK